MLDVGLAALGRGAGGHRLLRPLAALVDPPLDERDLLVAQRILVERHPVFAVLAEEAGDDVASGAVARLEERSRRAALHGELTGVEPQLAAALLDAVALVAMLLENRSDLGGEVDLLLGAQDGCGDRIPEEQQRRQECGAADEKGDTSRTETVGRTLHGVPGMVHRSGRKSRLGQASAQPRPEVAGARIRRWCCIVCAMMTARRRASSATGPANRASMLSCQIASHRSKCSGRSADTACRAW